jgi:glycosyltransferase involved in cell wall biosynthesis
MKQSVQREAVEYLPSNGGSTAKRSVDRASLVDRVAVEPSQRLVGKYVGMVTYSPYPFDPRPRRALDALVREGARIDLICLGDDNAPKREVMNAVEIFRVRLKHERGGKIGYAYRYAVFILIASLIFARRCLTRRYDLIYVHNMPDILVLSSLMPKILGAKVVLDLNDPMPELMMTIFQVPQSSRSVQLLSRLEKWSIARADLVITVSLTFQRIFCSRSCKEEKMAVVMNAPDGRIFRFREAGADVTSKERGKKSFVIMYHGSLVERNGLGVAIEALAQVRKAIPTAELRVFGAPTPFLEHMMELTRTQNLQGAVKYFGPKRLEDLVDEIEKCDLGVIPTQKNAFTAINTPTRIFEYLALGKAVIAPATQGIQDYFDQDSLLFFEPGNPSDLAQQIEYTFSHPREVLELVKKGQVVYLEHTWEIERETLLSRVSEILGAAQAVNLGRGRTPARAR